MTNCGYKIKHTCGNKIKAECVYYDTELPEFSKLKDETCVTAEETISELYKLIKEIKEGSDLKDLGASCVNYGVEKSKLTLAVTLKVLEKELCVLKNGGSGSSSNGNGGVDISKLDLKCLQSPCDTGIRSLQDLLQAIINKICA